MTKETAVLAVGDELHAAPVLHAKPSHHKSPTVSSAWTSLSINRAVSSHSPDAPPMATRVRRASCDPAMQVDSIVPETLPLLAIRVPLADIGRTQIIGPFVRVPRRPDSMRRTPGT